jgi:hypothetical protein
MNPTKCQIENRSGVGGISDLCAGNKTTVADNVSDNVRGAQRFTEQSESPMRNISTERGRTRRDFSFDFSQRKVIASRRITSLQVQRATGSASASGFQKSASRRRIREYCSWLADEVESLQAENQ